jgi:hypothetical protein
VETGEFFFASWRLCAKLLFEAAALIKDSIKRIANGMHN